MGESTTNPPLDLLKNRSFPEVAQALRSRSPHVLERWEQQVRHVLPAVEEMTLGELRNSVPRIIDQLIDALASDRPEATDLLIDISKPHGESRHHQTFNTNEVLIEYGLLRRVIFEETAAALDRDLTVDEINAVNLGIDTAQRKGVTTFVDQLLGQLKATDDLQSHYVSFLNHDLRGGMNGILLMVEVLKRELGAEARFAETMEDLEAMRRAVLDSVSTMDRFVFAYRLGRGKQQARFNVINVSSLVKDAVTQLTHAGKEKGVEFALAAPDGLSVATDRDMVRLIVNNVLGNAIKHAKRGGGKVQVTVKPRAGGGVTVTARDEGPGIPPDAIPSIFAPPSFDPEKGRSAVRLGLPVAKQAADLIEADLRVDSSPGAGTTVTLGLPERKA